MPVKTILVCLTTKEHCDALLRAAVPLARKHGAHLIGLHTLEALVVYPGIAMHIQDDVFRAFNASQVEESDAIEEIFKRHTQAEDFVSEYRVLPAASTTASERLIESARAADIVIMAHEDKETDRFDQRRAQSEVIRYSGRPVIVVPLDFDGPDLGANLLLGWSDTREAARAAHDLLTIADPGAKITVLRVGEKQSDALTDSRAIDVSETLARHGHNVSVQHTDYGGKDVADALMRVAFEEGADLIVTGAFGHSRAYDFVLGATTHALLKGATMPVMFCK